MFHTHLVAYLVFSYTRLPYKTGSQILKRISLVFNLTLKLKYFFKILKDFQKPSKLSIILKYNA